MAGSQDQSTTFSDGEAASIVTAPADLPLEPCTSLAEMGRDTRVVASTLDAVPDQVPVPPTNDAIWGLRSRDRLLLLFLGSVCLVLSVWHWGQLSGWGLEPVEINRLPTRIYDYRVDLNQATWVELMQLPGVGKTLAERILEHRDQHGPFQSVDELDNVRGIGPKTLEKLRPWLFIQEPATQ